MDDGPTAINTLIRHEALLIHSAGFAKMVGNIITNQYGYLERLQVAARDHIEIACSTILNGDSSCYYTGACGLILRPTGAEAITYAWPEDAGTSIGENGRRANVTQEARDLPLDEAITKREPNRYNEVGAYGYEVFGVFMDQADEVQYSIPDDQCKAILDELGNPPLDHPDYLRAIMGTVTAQDVRSAFPSLDLFHLERGRLYLINHAGQRSANAIPLVEIYRS